jgi:hypothetical protein
LQRGTRSVGGLIAQTSAPAFALRMKKPKMLSRSPATASASDAAITDEENRRIASGGSNRDERGRRLRRPYCFVLLLSKMSAA